MKNQFDNKLQYCFINNKVCAFLDGDYCHQLNTEAERDCEVIIKKLLYKKRINKKTLPRLF